MIKPGLVFKLSWVFHHLLAMQKPPLCLPQSLPLPGTTGQVHCCFHSCDKHLHRNLLGEGQEGFCGLTIGVCHREKTGRNLEAGAGSEAIEEHCLLACSSWFIQPAFLHNHDHLLTVGWAFRMYHQSRKMPTGLCTG